MKAAVAMSVLIFPAIVFGRPTEEPKLLSKVTPLPVALDPDFTFRKTKLYFLNDRTQQVGKGNASKNGQQGQTAGSTVVTGKAKSTSVSQDAAINFERQYRLFGAVTKLDQRERYGDYLDFYWRAKRNAGLTVRLEYRQEKLHAHVQAQEISYSSVRHGTHKTEFKVIGDDYADNGRILAWRCLLIENGKVVAQDLSFMWR